MSFSVTKFCLSGAAESEVLSITGQHSAAILGPVPEARKPNVGSKQIDLSGGVSLIDHTTAQTVLRKRAEPKKNPPKTNKRTAEELEGEDLENSMLLESNEVDIGEVQKSTKAARGRRKKGKLSDASNKVIVAVVARRGRGRPKKN